MGHFDREKPTAPFVALWARVIVFLLVCLSAGFAMAQAPSPAPDARDQPPASQPDSVEYSNNLCPYVGIHPPNSIDPFGLAKDQQGAWGDLLQGFGKYLNTSALALSDLPSGVAKIAQDLVSEPGLFLRRAGPGLAGLGMSVPLSRIPATGARTSGVEANGLAKGTAAAATETEYVLTQTVSNNIATRPYISSPLIIREITSTGRGVVDPGGIPGALRYDVPGSFNGSSGTYELVIQPTTNTIYHFLFRSGP